MDPKNLSRNDANVLSALFDPESSLPNPTCNIQIQEPPISTNKDSLAKAALLQAQERQALHPLNQERPSKTDIARCISLLSAIIQDTPSYASAWTNRAQARRMSLSLSQSQASTDTDTDTDANANANTNTDAELNHHPSAVAQILDDLAHAIDLATPQTPTDPISSLDARTLAAAHTHRGYLLTLASRSEQNHRMLDDLPALRDLPGEQLAELASRELALGGHYGNPVARQLAVKTNPYAKLCGSIVREALTKEIKLFYQPDGGLVG